MNAMAQGGTVAKMFTENWLQALTRSASAPAARLIKPLLNDIDSLCQTREAEQHTAAAQRVWEMCESHGLTPLLRIVPVQQTEWNFDDEETFAFAAAGTVACDTLETWKKALGLISSSFALTATVTATEWASFLRSEAVRQKRGMNVPPADVVHTLHMPVTAAWEQQKWSIQFDQTDWVQRNNDEPFQTSRPDLADIQEQLEALAITAESKLLPAKMPAAQMQDNKQWMNSVARLLPLHESLLSQQGSRSRPWFSKVWETVWPIIYREQNVLNKPCDLNALRDSLADCFREAPKLTLWMFAFAKLVCVAQLGRGLGICGNFRRG